MKQIFLIAFAFVLAPWGVLEAQSVAMVRGPITQERYATAIERNDTSILRANAEQILEAFQLIAPDVETRSLTDLARYIRHLEVRSCPQGVHELSRAVLPSRTIGWGVRRAFRAGEMCLYDTSLARFVLSLDCGNLIRPPAPVVEPASLNRGGEPAPVAIAPPQQVTPRDQTIEGRRPVIIVVNNVGPAGPWVRERGSSWVPKAIALVVVAGAITCAIICREDRDEVTSTPPSGGGPVNPPNGRKSRHVSFGLQLRF